ncbi:MAG: biotin transporter BioY [Candidatus Methanoperedens sp.]
MRNTEKSFPCESKLINKLALAFVFACLTGIFAQLRFYLPYTPVPVTGQVFAILIGFIFASLIIGWFTDRYIKSRSFAGLFSIMVLGIAIIYLFGVVQLLLVLGVNIQKAIELGALPFIGVDIYKALIVSAIAAAIVPGKAFGNELDAK